MLDSFRDFACIRSYLHLKSFTWKKDIPISSNYKRKEVEHGHSRKLLYLNGRHWKNLSIFKSYGILEYFDIQISITLAIFWEKLQNYFFQKSYRSLSKRANIHINRGSHYKITAL